LVYIPSLCAAIGAWGVVDVNPIVAIVGVEVLATVLVEASTATHDDLQAKASTATCGGRSLNKTIRQKGYDNSIRCATPNNALPAGSQAAWGCEAQTFNTSKREDGAMSACC